MSGFFYLSSTEITILKYYFSILVQSQMQNALFKSLYSFCLVHKNREPFLDSPEVRKKVWDHIRENAKGKGIFIDAINGHHDHCHCLVSLGRDQSMSKIMMLIKGGSAYWINRHTLCKKKFEWQDEYFALSVSKSIVGKVREYINNQEEHHCMKNFKEKSTIN